MIFCPRPHRFEPRTDASAVAMLRDQRGSVLIATILAVVVVASLGASIYSFVSTSGRTQIGSMNDTTAYYLAESGYQYALKQLAVLDGSNTTAYNTLVSSLTAAPFTINNAGQFQLQNFTHTTSGGFDYYKFTAIGMPTAASISRSIGYTVQVSSVAGIAIPFDGSGGTLNANNWNTSGQAALDTTNKLVSMNNGSYHNSPTQVSLDWTNANTTLPNLQTAWKSNNGFLTYEVQAKFNLSTGNNRDVMGGISFRLKTQGDTNIANDSFYGLSYVVCQGSGDLPTFCNGWTDAGKTYIVLWKQAANGTQTLLGKELASNVSPALVDWSGHLVDWSTLVVRIEEQIDPNDGVTRENLIYAFAGDPTQSPKGTIAWDYTKFAAVPWGTYIANASSDCSGGLKTFIKDTTFLTTNFNTTPQDEVGLHAFGKDTVQVADLALRFNFDGGVATTCVAPSPGTLVFASSTFSVPEQSGPATITVSRQNGTSGAVGVNYATVATGSTATAGSDYTAVSGTLTWADGDTSSKTFTIPIVNDLLTDGIIEGNQTVNLALSAASGGASLGSPSTAVLTIIDNTNLGVTPLDNWPSSPQASSSGGTSLSTSFATSAGTNRMTVCAVTAELNNSSSSFNVSGNYGGQSFTTMSSTNGRSSWEHVWIGYVNEAQITARGSNTVSLSISAGSSLAASDLYCGSCQGVNQTTPVAGSRANTNTSGSSTAYYGGSVNETSGGYIFYILATWKASSSPPTGYTEYFDTADSYYHQSGAIKKVITTGTENPSWSLSTSTTWGLAVGSLNPTP